MSHTIYNTNAIVLDRLDSGDADLTLWLLTQDLGLVIARAQGARKEVAKMRSHLQMLGTLSASMVRGKYQWRLTGAEPATQVEHKLSGEALRAFARIAKFIKRMTISDESVGLYNILLRVKQELAQCSDINKVGTVELLAVARVLIYLGYMDKGILSKADITKGGLTADVNKAINESHL